jgi:aryl-alcohol dehydrogenase-like predicted oxidoreductase
MIAGFATLEGTARFRHRFPKLRDAGHFRRPDWVSDIGSLWLSSIGIGTYLGETDEAADRAYTEAIVAAIRGGTNVVDSAINYRHQRSERNIGAAIQQLAAAGEIHRDELLICTKAGFLTVDGDVPADPRAYFVKEYIEPGILDPAEVAGGVHCMSPRYLADQIDRSRRNLQLETLDVFYVHNPESQLGAVPWELFQQRLSAAFGACERAVAANKIRWYGVATWNAFRVANGERDHLPMEAVLDAARAAGGDAHHFRFIQLPFNLGMPQPWALQNHRLGGEAISALELARRRGIAVVGSATLHQGQLTSNLPDFISKALGTATDAEAAIQFARSAPGLVTALVGMGHAGHVAENLEVASRPPASFDQWKKLFRKSSADER